MVRGRGGFGRGGFRGSGRGNWSGGYGNRSSDRFFGGGKYTERYSRMDDYRTDDYPREHHSPPRKRSRQDGSRHEYGLYGNSGRYDDYASERKGGYSGERERHIASSGYTPRREEFRKPAPPTPRGSFRGRLVKGRGGRRDRGMVRRRMAEGSYRIRKRDTFRFIDRRAKPIKIRSRKLTEEELAEDSDEEMKEEVEGEETTLKTEVGEETEAAEGAEGTEDDSKEATEDKEGEEKPKVKKEKPASTHAALMCPQCNVKLTTFRDYEIHIYGRTHKLSMRKMAMKQRSILMQMRQAQRSTQNELEKNSSADELASRTRFCPICQLNFKQLKSVHQATQAHKNMKSYLYPICKLCGLGFSSPMMYQKHLCSFQHLKKKQRSTAAGETTVEDNNLDEFTTIDSVGENEETTNADEEATTNADEEKEVSVGIDLIKKVDVYYCELCRIYLPRVPEAEVPDLLSSHCRRRSHMQRYIKRKEHEDLIKFAQNLRRKESAQKKKNTDKKEGEGDADKKASEDDKMWDSVDKDLGELLEGEAADDDEDDSRVNGERFDRFKSDEKDGTEGSGDAKKEGDAAASAETK